jgi:hypothetical protein
MGAFLTGFLKGAGGYALLTAMGVPPVASLFGSVLISVITDIIVFKEEEVKE